MNYFVLLCDIVDSRGIKKRRNFQNQFKQYIERINRDYKNQIISPFTVTLGDEFQGVMRDTANLFIFIRKLQLNFSDITFRFAFSIGNIINMKRR